MDFRELTGLILEQDAAALGQNMPALFQAVEELRALEGFQQHSPHHAYDILTHTLLVTAALPADPVLRWAGMLHDVGKPGCFTRDETGRGHFKGHAPAGAELAGAILTRLQAPEALTDQVKTLIGLHMLRLPEEPAALKAAAEALGRETLDRLLLLQEADMVSKGMGEPRERDQFPRLRQLLARL